MIKREIIGNFVKTYSDAGFKIQCGSSLYTEAVDPIASEKEYIETNIPIPTRFEPEDDEW